MYYFIRFFVRQALKIYCGRIRVNDESLLALKGPLLLASNHPNSFFDAIILASLMHQPVHFLALGELTDKFLLSRIMKIFKIIPVYRLHDKPGNQERNDRSFAICVDVLLKDGIVLTFSEGVCENNWQLRPLKKGTARIALAAMAHAELQTRLRILPVGLNYNSYTQPGKTVLIQFGEPILNMDLATGNSESEKMQILNELLRERLSASMLQTGNKTEMAQIMISNCTRIHTGQMKKLQDKLNGTSDETIISKLKKPGFFISRNHTHLQTLILVLLLAIPAVLGWVSHVFIYYPVKLMVERKTAQSVYFDSVLFTSLFLVYPFYWIGWNIFGYLFFKNLWLQVLFLCMPLLAWATVYWKKNWQRVRNFFILSKNERYQLVNYFN
jgi:1-acyl-sn-glycerol-3-phosphate acyltransferase